MKNITTLLCKTLSMLKVRLCTTFSSCAILMLITYSANAQILNIEKERQELDENDSVAWRGNFVFGFDLTKQENSVLELDNAGFLLHLTPKNAYIAIAHLNLIKSEGENIISDGYFHVRTNLGRKHKVSTEVFSQYQYNEARGLEKRALVGISPRFNLVDKEKIDFAIGIGTMYEWEQWTHNEQDSVTRLVKSTNYVNFHVQASENVEFMWITYYQARFDRFFHPRIISDANMSVSISKHITFNLHFSPMYDAAPVVDVEKWNYEIASGIGIKF